MWTGSHNLQIDPYTLGQNEHTLMDLDPLDPYFSSRTLEGTAGGEVKAVLKDSIVLDATINPDFSDIESDQPQFTVNQRYPVYFPELRPFFLENANCFATPIQLVYTRNIVRPTFGVRATGKIAGTNMGFFWPTIEGRGETICAWRLELRQEGDFCSRTSLPGPRQGIKPGRHLHRPGVCSEAGTGLAASTLPQESTISGPHRDRLWRVPRCHPI